MIKQKFDILSSASTELSAINHGPQIDEAIKRGLEVVIATDTDIQLDIDSPKLPDCYWARLKSVQEIIPLTYIKQTTSRSGNLHVYHKLSSPLSPLTRIAIQTFLGSDPVREFRNAMRVHLGVVNPIILFEVKDPQNANS